MELCQGIWALNGAGVLFFVVYIYVHTSVLQRDISLNIYFSYHQLSISLHNVQNKVYFKYFKRYFVFNHETLFLHTYIKLKVSQLYSIILRVYLIF